MNRFLKIYIMTSIICLLFVILLPKSVPASPIDPEYDYAVFVNDAYPESTLTIRVHYHHESYCTMYIYLYNPTNSVVKTWTISTGQRSGDLTYTATHTHGIWRLQCYMKGQRYWTDATLLHKFDIANPAPGDNLGVDWARTLNEDIYHKALEILGQSTCSSSYEAAQIIKSHVRTYFQNHLPHTYQKDADMLSTFNAIHHYYGDCKGDAVILTAYARALGIPARIIRIDVKGTEPELGDDEHSTAEFYVSGTWIPVDSDPRYDWFGLIEANQKLHSIYQDLVYIEEIWIIDTVANEGGGGSEIPYDGANDYQI